MYYTYYIFNFYCFRPFSVNLIPHTNLIMIVADKMCPCFSTKISIEPTKVEYGPANETAYCERLKYSIYRRMPSHCLNYHAEVCYPQVDFLCYSNTKLNTHDEMENLEIREGPFMGGILYVLCRSTEMVINT